MKAFLLDPAKRNSSAVQVPGFMQMAITRAGWEFSRPPVLDQGTDGPKWVSDLRKGIEEADLLVGLGNFLAFVQSGADLEKLLMLIRQKIDSGCPALFDGCANLLSNSFPVVEKQILALIESYGIHITTTKVASRLPEFRLHSSDLCCGFHKEDDSLLDPRLFQDMESAWAYGNRLIQYEPDIFPLIEASGLHFFVDKGDLLTVGNLGRKNAVAVSQVRNKRCLIVLSGNFFHDRAETLGGTTPGVEDNKAFAENVIAELTSHVVRPIDFAVSSYALLRELEARLGDLIEKVLTGATTDGNFISLLPVEIQNKLRSETGIPDYSRAMYVDLVNIVHKVWPQFEPFFVDQAGKPMARKSVTKPLSSLNTQRIYLAHPHKAKQHGRAENAEDVESLSRALEMVRLASARVPLTMTGSGSN